MFGIILLGVVFFVLAWIGAILFAVFSSGPGVDQKSAKAFRKGTVLVPKRGLKIPAQIVYNGGSEPGARRDVLINSITDSIDPETGASTQIVATFCLKAGATRHFRADRIVELIDIETGEIVVDIPLWIVDSIAARMSKKRAETVARARQIRMARKADVKV